MKKLIGWVLAIVGLVGIAATTVPQVKSAIPVLETINNTILTIASLVIVLIGLFIIIKGRSSRVKRGTEVPIFKGKEIVGYRRH